MLKKLRFKYEHPPEAVHDDSPTVPKIYIENGKALIKVQDVLKYGSVRASLPPITKY